MHIFSGQYKNKKILAPKGVKTRPTSGRMREALFNICQSCVEGSRFLDLFAGTGAMGLEALSRGAATVTFVDNSKGSMRTIQANIESLQLENQAEVLYANVFEMVERLAKKGKVYDIIYADPPYESFIQEKTVTLSYSERLLKMMEALIQTQRSILAIGGSLFLEDATKALVAPFSLTHLVLKSSRQMGRSTLWHYKYKGEAVE